MIIHSTRLGAIEISEEQIIHFPQGLVGFSNEKNFAYIALQEEGPFAFLQSVNRPELAFLVADPFVFFMDYEFELEDHLAEELAIGSENKPLIITIISLIDKPENMTANLLAPLVINQQTRQGIQIVLDHYRYTTNEPLFTGERTWQSFKGAK